MFGSSFVRESHETVTTEGILYRSVEPLRHWMHSLCCTWLYSSLVVFKDWRRNSAVDGAASAYTVPPRGKYGMSFACCVDHDFPA